MGNKIIICRGCPLSGKSTWARKYVTKKGIFAARVCRDDIRLMLGKYWIPSRENLVSEIEESCVREILESGRDVVIDATNFKLGWIKNIADDFKAEIEIKEFYQPLWKLYYRAYKRKLFGGIWVSPKIIKKFYDRYETINNKS